MTSNTMRRLLVVIGVTLVSLWLIFPTIRYFLGVSGTIPVEEAELAELKSQSVPLGLDLQGGVDVLLAVDTQQTQFAKVSDVADVLRAKFSSEVPVIEGSVEATSGSREIIVTVNRQDQVRAADNAITEMAQNGYFDYNAGSLQPNQPTPVEVRDELLSQDMRQTVESSIKVIRERVDSLGVTQPIVVQQGNDRIRVQIPGERDPQKAISTMIRPAKLEFRGVYTSQPSVDEKGDQVWPEASSELIDILTGQVLEGQRIPPGYEVRPYRITSPGERGQEPQTLERYMVVKKQAEMTGASLKDARVQVGQSAMNPNEVEVIVIFNDEGTEKFAALSEKYLKKPLAVLLDDVVYSAPTIQTPITGGYCSITGGFTQREAVDLSLVLKAGALPAELITKDMRTVEATLGADSISKSVLALFLGSILVGIYMIAYYGIAGVIAMVAVCINVILIFAFMKMANATLTLSGIGGILLTVGMAVDANVLIYERIREELRAGKNIKQAIQLGFGKAFSVIFDANLTTLICGLVLLQFGEGSVKGFALALNVGILATLFTGLFVTKTLIDFYFEKASKINFGTFRWFREDLHIDFLKMRKGALISSSAVAAVFLIYLIPAVNGSNWGVDFEGGLLTEVSVNEEMNTQQVQGRYNDWRVQKVAGENHFLVRTKVDDETQTLRESSAEISRRLDETAGAGNYVILSSEGVSNEVGREFTQKAIIASILASLGILIYLAFRFEFVFGIAAVIALFHDVLLAYGLFNVFGDIRIAGEVTLDIIAALLVVLGYSVNDTIIIFDRIRENRQNNPSMPDYKLINMSINESLNRTIITVSTVALVLITMLIFGGTGLFDFALVLLMGILLGTYSSIFLAAPLVFIMHERARKKGKAITYRKAGGEQDVRPMLSNRA